MTNEQKIEELVKAEFGVLYKDHRHLRGITVTNMGTDHSAYCVNIEVAPRMFNYEPFRLRINELVHNVRSKKKDKGIESHIQFRFDRSDRSSISV